jgi:zinc/manganese transport system substrate-binding protein
MSRRLPATRLTVTLLAVAAAPALVLAGCSAGTPAAEDDGLIHIVSSTNVYADIAQSIGGDLVTTQAIIAEAAADPHSYEATTRDQLAVSDADLLILNGGGYDSFMETLIDASGATAPVINAVDVSGLLEDDHVEDEDHDHEAEETADVDDHDGHDHIEGFNEHVWYSLHAMEHIAEEIGRELAELNPEGATTFEANAETFITAIEALDERQHEFADANGGLDALVTEPVPLYLLEGMGFVNVTPAAFTEAVEEGSEISVSVLDEVLQFIGGGTIAILGYNDQTTSPETERVLAAAESGGVPVVGFAETLPDGEDYVSWMTANIDAVETAIR